MEEVELSSAAEEQVHSAADKQPVLVLGLVMPDNILSKEAAEIRVEDPGAIEADRLGAIADGKR